MILVVTQSTLSNPQVLATSATPRRFLGRSPGIRPKGVFLRPLFWRMLFEHSLSRYVVALAPFPVAMLIWPDLALPISQAPVLMFGIVLYLESNVLSVPTPEKRRALMDADAAERGLDLLQVRARAALTRFAARRGLREGVLLLVIEQSAMARTPPLTLVSVQLDGPEPAVLDLDADERAALVDDLFDAAFDDALLHRINLSQNSFLRSVALDARSVSAHARLDALAARAGARQTRVAP